MNGHSMDMMTVKEATEKGLLVDVEERLNERLRPNLTPLLKYARTPRLSVDLMAAYNISLLYGQGYVCAMAETKHHSLAMSVSYSTGDNKAKAQAICMAVACMALTVLIYLEKEDAAKANAG